MRDLFIYTDGGCSGNPGPGGWAFILKVDDKEVIRSGAARNTTNNRMELTAVIRALEEAEGIGGTDESTQIHVMTDSQYVKNGITDWIVKWERNGWKTASKNPVKNQEFWQELRSLTKRMNIRWIWVKGHAGHEMNERCDSLVQEAIRENRG